MGIQPIAGQLMRGIRTTLMTKLCGQGYPTSRAGLDSMFLPICLRTFKAAQVTPSPCFSPSDARAMIAVYACKNAPVTVTTLFLQVRAGVQDRDRLLHR